ncbi:MAG TPA: enoyl-CoA hydratase/isomerase family protein [Rhizobiales bacterium]|nr:enoyl-CoA hydratase/isomerase family protein [Hyphomicrobiales bacterium]
MNGSHRVVTEKVTFAMPETGIGLFPDVGGTYFLPRCPGETGMYLGLTGARLKAPDTLYTGLATHHTPSGELPQLLDALCAADDVDACLDRFAQAPEGEALLATMRRDIDHCFGAASVEAILESLAGQPSEWAQKTAGILRKKSPTSLAITFRQLRAGKTLSFEDAMKLEFRIVNRIFTAHDFFEGTRAVVIDKDNAPNWQPASLDDISKGDIDAYFAPLEHELDL